MSRLVHRSFLPGYRASYIILSGQSVHLAKWMHALEQVTDWHLVKWPHDYFRTKIRLFRSAKCTKFLIFIEGTWPSTTHRHSAKWSPTLVTLIAVLSSSGSTGQEDLLRPPSPFSASISLTGCPLARSGIIRLKGAFKKFNDSQKRKFVSKGGGGVNSRCLTFCRAQASLIHFRILTQM